MKILALPGIRIESITNKALEVAEQRFDTFYVMDIENVASGTALPVTSSAETVDITATADRFRSRLLDSSFGAAYFPDVSILSPSPEDSDLETEVFVPASIHALRVLGRSDRTASLLAPSGPDRGAVSPTGIQSKVKFESTQRSSIKKLYEVGINPIIEDVTTGLYVFGSRTLMTTADSLFQSIAIRRMVLELRRQIKDIAENLLFEQSQEQTLKEFELLARPVVNKLVSRGGIRKFKVKIDTTTTTEADIKKNIVRGQIYIQPIRSDEIIQVDF